jgi:hypothetical protein
VKLKILAVKSGISVKKAGIKTLETNANEWLADQPGIRIEHTHDLAQPNFAGVSRPWPFGMQRNRTSAVGTPAGSVTRAAGTGHRCQNGRSLGRGTRGGIVTYRFALCIDANDPDLLQPFWSVALGYLGNVRPGQTINLVDPRGQVPAVWFQRVPKTKSIKNRGHLDIWLNSIEEAPDPGLPVPDLDLDQPTDVARMHTLLNPRIDERMASHYS